MKKSVFLFILSSVVLLSSCSTKRNTAANRHWQEFITRYNVYFNGDEHLKEQLKQMEDSYEADFSHMLPMHPADSYANPKLPQPTGDFTRTIEKMQKAIQLHSITRKPIRRNRSQKDRDFRNRTEFNPFLHNAWITLGMAQYYYGDFSGAAITFRYITNHFSWLPETVTLARLWQARSYCALGWRYEAENVLHLVKEKDLTNRHLRDLYNFVEADYLIQIGNYAEAAPYLKLAAEKATGSQKNRLWFLLGQIYSNIGEKELAYEAFAMAGKGVSTPYRTKFNARIKQSEVFSAADISKEVNSLKRMIRYQRNRDYFDRIYYAIGNLYLSRKDTTEAIHNYRLAINSSVTNGTDKALAQLALANIYYSRHNYVEAQPLYSESLPLIPDDYPNYSGLLRRSDVLDQLAVYAGNVALQDSLLTLSKLPESEQRKTAQKIADQLIKKEKEARSAAERDEYLANNATTLQLGATQNQIQGMAFNNDNSWYFYNDMIRNAGKTEFLRKWGSRKLEDDWRRSNKTTFSFDDVAEADDPQPQEADEQAKKSSIKQGAKPLDRSNDPHFAEYYLKQIPHTPEEIEASNDVIEEGLYNMGLILKDRLMDYSAARIEFEKLLSRYPENPYRLDVYYNMFLMAAHNDDKASAEEWRQKILKDFPESDYGIAMKNPDYFDNLRRMHDIQENIYADAYSAYLADNNEKVHKLTAEMEEKYPLSPLLPKFVFINSLAYLSDGDNEMFHEGLKTLLKRWPETDMTETASAILKQLDAGKTPVKPTSNSLALLWNTRLSEDKNIEMPIIEETRQFDLNPDSPQYLVLTFPLDQVNPNQVLYEVARFNFSTFLVKDFDLEQMNFSNLGLLIIKGFSNLKEVERYRSAMGRSDIDLPEDVIPVMISKENFDILLKDGMSFEDYFRFIKETDPEDD